MPPLESLGKHKHGSSKRTVKEVKPFNLFNTYNSLRADTTRTLKDMNVLKPQSSV